MLPDERSRATGPGASRFERLEELGSGAAAIVFRARDPKLGREVALKQLRAGFEVDSSSALRFRREAEILGRLSHPNIVAVHELIERPPCIVMELVPGVSLARILVERRHGRPALIALVEKVARALEHAHANGVIHRDLKPANILVVPSAPGGAETLEPRVADFGVAHLADQAQRLTRTGAFLGTPSYMAPEQAQGRTRDLGATTDVYALGVILYEVLTGTLPHNAPTLLLLLEKIQHAPIVAPHVRASDVPRDLSRITLKALAREPGARYPTAAALADDLRAHLEGRSSGTRGRRKVALAVVWASVVGLGAFFGLRNPSQNGPSPANGTTPGDGVGASVPPKSASPAPKPASDEEALRAILHQVHSLPNLVGEPGNRARFASSAGALYRLGLARQSRDLLEAAHFLGPPVADDAIALARFWTHDLDNDEFRRRYTDPVFLAEITKPGPENALGRHRARLVLHVDCVAEATAFPGVAAAVPPPCGLFRAIIDLEIAFPDVGIEFARTILSHWPGSPALDLVIARNNGYPPRERLEHAQAGLKTMEPYPDDDADVHEIKIELARAGDDAAIDDENWPAAIELSRRTHDRWRVARALLAAHQWAAVSELEYPAHDDDWSSRHAMRSRIVALGHLGLIEAAQNLVDPLLKSSSADANDVFGALAAAYKAAVALAVKEKNGARAIARARAFEANVPGIESHRLLVLTLDDWGRRGEALAITRADIERRHDSASAATLAELMMQRLDWMDVVTYAAISPEALIDPDARIAFECGLHAWCELERGDAAEGALRRVALWSTLQSAPIDRRYFWTLRVKVRHWLHDDAGALALARRCAEHEDPEWSQPLLARELERSGLWREILEKIDLPDRGFSLPVNQALARAHVRALTQLGHLPEAHALQETVTRVFPEFPEMLAADSEQRNAH